MTDVRRNCGTHKPDLSPRALAQEHYGVDNGGCVEVANLEHAVAVRDSKDPAGPALVWDRDEWTSFLVRITAK